MPSPIIIRHLQLVKPTVQHRVQQRVMIPDVLKYSLRLESIHVQNVIRSHRVPHVTSLYALLTYR